MVKNNNNNKNSNKSIQGSESKRSKKQLNLYFKSYKGGGVNDVPYWNLFQHLQQFIDEYELQQQQQRKEEGELCLL